MNESLQLRSSNQKNSFSFAVTSGEVLDSSSIQAILSSLHRVSDLSNSQKRHFNNTVRRHFLTDIDVFRRMLSVLDSPEVHSFIFSRTRRPYVDHLDFLIKDPNAPETLWHQDSAYWTWDTDFSMFTIWVALSEVNEQNGCLRVVTDDVGHVLPHKKCFHDEASASYQLALDIEKIQPESYSIQNLKMRPGQAVIFDSRVLHSAFANQTEFPRYAFKIVLGDRAAGANRRDRVMNLATSVHKIDRRLNYWPTFFKLKAIHEFRTGVGNGLRRLRNLRRRH